MEPGPHSAPPEVFTPFDDAKASRTRIYDSVLSAARSIKPIDNGIYKLALEDVDYLDDGEPDPEKVTAAKLKGRTLERRMGGTWRMYDQTGRVVSERQQTVGAVPIQTDFGTFINRGNATILRNQQRLRAGMYARRKKNDELEVMANFLPGQGLTHRYGLDPEKGIFYANFRQSNIPAYSMLRAMGASDDDVKSAWGEDLFRVNKARARYDDDVRRLAKQVLPAKEQQGDFPVLEKNLRERLAAMQLNPETTARTLKEPHANLSPRAVLLATRRLLSIAKGEDEPDSRDAMSFQEMVYPDKLFAERIAKDYAGEQKKILFKATHKGNLDWLPNAPLRGQIYSALLNSGLGQMPEAPNPLEMLDRRFSVTRLGEGGISGFAADMDVFTRKGWKAWPDVTAEDELACRVDGRLTFRKPTKLYAQTYAGDMYVAETERLSYSVTPTHRTYVSYATSGTRMWSEWQYREARSVHGKVSMHAIAAERYEGGASSETFEILPAPVQGKNRGSAAREAVSVPFRAWLELLAAYLADGSSSYTPSRREYRTEIGKRASVNPEEAKLIQATLERLPFCWRYEQDRRFVICGKALAYLFSQFGKSAEKFIPDYVFTASPEDRLAFLERLTTFDCSIRTPTRLKYASASSRLRDQVADLAILAGQSVTYKQLQKEGENPQYVVVLRTATETTVSSQHAKNQYRVESYDGMVYGAEVEGGLLFVRRNGKTHWSGDSVDSVPDQTLSSRLPGRGCR